MHAEETIAATLDSNGQLTLIHRPQLPPGPVQVTIRVAAPSGHGLAEVVRQIATEQRARGFPGRSATEILAQDNARDDEDNDRDHALDAARRRETPGGA